MSEVSKRIQTSLEALTRIPIKPGEYTGKYLQELPCETETYSLPFSPSRLEFFPDTVNLVSEFVRNKKGLTKIEKLFDQVDPNQLLLLVDFQLPAPDNMFVVTKANITDYGQLMERTVWLEKMVRPSVLVAACKERGMSLFAYSFAAFFK